MIDVLERDKCTGCKLCEAVCNENAISFSADNEGFWYPSVDSNKCIQCGVCYKKCPSINPGNVRVGTKKEVYAAWSKSSIVRDESTSGGVFWEIASKFISEGGVVVGSLWHDDFKAAKFGIAQSEEELVKLRGSKYIQSDTKGIYPSVLEQVEIGKKVLFCGTPCQNAAMQSFLKGKDEHVWYIDFICRSVNSPKALAAYVSDMERINNSKVVSLRQKSKKKGWQSLATHIVFENGKELLLDKYEDTWIKGFIENDLFTRDSCFSCSYRCLPRKCADLTIGDFWGIEGASTYDLYKGISVVFVNTERGGKLLHKSNELILTKKPLQEAIDGNPALLSDTIRNGKKQIFFDKLNEKGFVESVEEIIGEISLENDDVETSLQKDRARYRKNGEIDEELYRYLNYHCENVVRKGKSKIIPYKNAIFDLQKDALIILDGDTDWEVGINLLKGSKIETLVRLGRKAKVHLHHGGLLFYGTTLEVKNDAFFEAGFFSANTGSVFVADKKIYFGEDVMIGRNVMIYDSDFHQILGEDGIYRNFPKEVIIEDHVWLTANININKGVHIGQGTIVANQTVLNRSVPSYSLVAGQSNGHVIREGMRWSRNSVKKYQELFGNKRIILYGYGIEGKKFFKKYSERIEYVIDNGKKESFIFSFEEFLEKNSEIMCKQEEWMCIIAAPNYFSEIYEQMRNHFANMLIINYSEI